MLFRLIRASIKFIFLLTFTLSIKLLLRVIKFLGWNLQHNFTQETERMHQPEDYENNKSAAKRDTDQFTTELISKMHWSQNEAILDYGCGAGSVAREHFVPLVQKHNSTLECIDISAEMINHAVENFPHPLVKYIQGDILSDSFPYLQQSFDKIFAIYVLHFIRDYKKAIKRFYEILKPGGQFGFTILSHARVFEIYQYLGPMPKWSKYFAGYEKYVPEWFEKCEIAEESIKKAVLEAGFVINEVKTAKQTYHFPKFETLIELYIALNPFMKRIPEELHADLRNEYRKYLAKYYEVPSDSPSIDSRYEMIVGLVQKM